MQSRFTKIMIVICLVVVVASVADARMRGTIKTYSGETYYDVSMIIYEDLQEIRFHDSFGNSGVIQFTDVFRLLDENGNDITSYIRPYIVRPRNLFSNPNYNPADLSLGEVLKPRLIIGLGGGVMGGTFLQDRFDEDISKRSTRSFGGTVGLLIHIYQRGEVYFGGTYSGMFNSDYPSGMSPEIITYNLLLRINFGNLVARTRARFYATGGFGVLTLNETLSNFKYHTLTTGILGGGMVYALSYRIKIETSLLYTFMLEEEFNFDPSKGHIWSLNIGLNYRL